MKKYLLIFFVITFFTVFFYQIVLNLCKRGDTERITRIGDTSWVNFKIKIYYLNEDWKLCSINSDGTSKKVLFDDFTFSPGITHDLYPSPDEKSLLLKAYGKLFLISSQDSKVDFLTNGDGILGWSPNGENILFGRINNSSGFTDFSKRHHFTLYLFNIKSRQEKEILEGHENLGGGDCSDGCSYWFDDSQIYIVDCEKTRGNQVFNFYSYDVNSSVITKIHEEFKVSRDDGWFREKVKAVLQTINPDFDKWRWRDNIAYKDNGNLVNASSLRRGSYEVRVKEATIVLKNQGKVKKIFQDMNFADLGVNIKGALSWLHVYWLPDNRHLIFNYPGKVGGAQLFVDKNGIRSFQYGKISPIYIIDVGKQKIGKLINGFLLYWQMF